MTPEVNDPDGHKAKFDAEKAKLKGHEPEADSRQLRAWANSMTVEPSTAYWLLNKNRLLSEASESPLVEIDDKVDLINLIDDVAGDFAEGTKRKYRQAARKFFDEWLAREWATEIPVGKSPTAENPVTRDQILNRTEVDALFDAVTNPRDRALLSTLLATGQRIGALLSLRVSDVTLEGRTGRITLNDDALGLKGASGPRPLIWATEDMKNWLMAHPRRHDDDAPLFCTLKGGHGGNHTNGNYYEYERGDPLTRQQVDRRLKQLAQKADVDIGKVNPHNFRHTAITRMDAAGVGEQRIKWMVGWHKDSGQLERYSHLTDEEQLGAFLDDMGVEGAADASEEIGRPTIEECVSCGAQVRPGSSFCPGCGVPLTQKAADVQEDANDELLEAAMTNEIPDDLVRAVAEQIKQNPEILK